MVKKIIWMPQTFEDIDSIAEYISRDSINYASAFVDKIFEAGESLDTFYNRGRVISGQKDKNIREIFISEYRIIYQIKEFEINILTVVHGRKDIKKLFKRK